MHHFSSNKAGFIFNSDFSGNVTITADGKSVELPAEDILKFVAYYFVMPKQIAKVEQQSVHGLLGVEE
jgi:hypothetical protein